VSADATWNVMRGYRRDIRSIANPTVPAAQSVLPNRNSPDVRSAPLHPSGSQRPVDVRPLAMGVAVLREKWPLAFPVEHQDAFQHGAAVNRRRDAARTAVEQPCAESVLQVGDELRHRGMRHAKVGGRLCQTSMLHDSEEDVQVPQPQSAANVVVPIDDLSHKQKLSAMKDK
jgi:hypothetical protein